MNKIFLIAGIVIAGAASVFAQRASQPGVAGQSIWRHDGPTSVIGQSIWRHDGLPGSVNVGLPREVVRHAPRRQGTVVLLGIGPTCDVRYDWQATQAVYQERQDYYQPGYQWGAAMRENAVAWADFVPYLAQYLLMASPNAQWAFREGFAKGFGGNGAETYDRAFRQASRG